jgi:ERCC4-type nuclease
MPVLHVGGDKAGRHLALPPLPSGVAVSSLRPGGLLDAAVNKRGPLVLMDQREPKDLQAKMLSTFGDRLQICFLNHADFILTDRCGCCLGIERKTVNDFLGSLKSGRLENQMQRVMGDLHPCLLLEGTVRTVASAAGTHRQIVSGGSGNWSYGSLQMKVWSLQERGTRVIWTTGQPGIVGGTWLILWLLWWGQERGYFR